MLSDGDTCREAALGSSDFWSADAIGTKRGLVAAWSGPPLMTMHFGNARSLAAAGHKDRYKSKFSFKSDDVCRARVSTRIRVISLPSATERRAVFAAAAAGAHPWEFFDAEISASPSLVFNARDAALVSGRPMSGGEIGAYSSHYQVWRDFASSDDDQLVVLEDDVVCDWLFLNFLVKHDFEKMNIHYLRLFAKQPSRYRRVASPFLDIYHHLVQYTGLPLGAQGYILTRAGASLLIAHCRALVRPVDWEMDRSWAHGLANLAIFPFPLFERSVPSGIGEARFRTMSVDRSDRLEWLRIRITEKIRRFYFANFSARTFIDEIKLPI